MNMRTLKLIYIENNTDKSITIQSRDTSIDGFFLRNQPKNYRRRFTYGCNYSSSEY